MEMEMTVGAIDCSMEGKFDNLLGIILCLIGAVPAFFWISRFAMGMATDARVLMFGVPFVCVGLYFIERHRCREGY